MRVFARTRTTWRPKSFTRESSICWGLRARNARQLCAPKPCGGGVTARAYAQAPVDLTPVVEQVVRTVRFSFKLGEFFDYTYQEPLVYMVQRIRMDAYLAECAARGFREVRIIHGKGTGTLRTTVHALLRRSPLVESFRLGDEHSGSWGATLVTLRR